MFPNPFPGNRPPSPPPAPPHSGRPPAPPFAPPHGAPHGNPHGNPGRHSAPTSPPPDFVPPQSRQTRAIDPGAIRGCMNNFVYVWLRNGQSFWMFPTFVGRQSISGYRWSHFGWVYTGFSLRLIESFFCMR